MAGVVLAAWVAVTVGAFALAPEPGPWGPERADEVLEGAAAVAIAVDKGRPSSPSSPITSAAKLYMCM